MGSHVGWHIAVCCPLRGGKGEFRKKTPKTIKEKQIFSKTCRHKAIYGAKAIADCRIPVLMKFQSS
jgi:hypothetical protein